MIFSDIRYHFEEPIWHSHESKDNEDNMHLKHREYQGDMNYISYNALFMLLCLFCNHQGQICLG